MDSFLIRIVGIDLDHLKDYYVSKIKQLSNHTVQFVLSKGGEKKGVIASINPKCPRIYVTSNIYTGVEPSGFVMLLRKKLVRSRLSSVYIPPFERVIFLHFSSGYSFIFEVFGRFSAMYLTEGDKILGSFGKRKDLDKNYFVPKRSGIYPDQVCEDNFEQALREGIIGFPAKAMKEVKEKGIVHLKRLIHMYREGIYPWGSIDFDGLYRGIEEEEGKDLDERIEGERRNRIKKLEKLLKRLESEREKLFERLGLKKKADLLASNLHRVKKGDRFVEVLDYETGKIIRIDLDPSKSPSENLEYLYSAYKKAKKGILAIEERIKEIKSEMELEREMKGILKADVRKEVRKSLFNSSVAKYISPSGFTVYVGLNAKGNEIVRRELGSPDDLWFHLKDLKGPHVILRVGRGDVKPEDILFAATLALGGRKGRFQVDYTRLKYVRKPKGSSKGFVTYTNFKTLVVDGS